MRGALKTDTVRIAFALALAAVACGAAAEDRGQMFVARTGQSYAAPSVATRQEVAREFYRSHGDDYDFLVVFPAIPADLGRDTRGLHYLVRNDVAGIGLPMQSDAVDWGSRGRLRGYVDVGALIPAAGAPSVDDALGVLAHEVAHQWAARVSYFDGATGQFRTDLLGRDEAHWSFFLGSDASVMYGSAWTARPGGTFGASESRKRYSPLDLYLMGLLPPGEVPPLVLLDPAVGTTFLATDVPPPDGTVVAASARTVTIEQIIAAEGPRVPAAAASQRSFRAAFVLLLAPGQTPSADQLAFVDEVRRRWANEFFFLTRGAGVFETALVGAVPGDVAAHPSIGSGLDFLLAAQRADGAWADRPETVFRDTQAALELLGRFRSDPRVPPAIARAVAYLGTHLADDADGAARRLLALAAGNAPALPGDEAVAALGARVSAGGVGLRRPYGSTVIDTALVGQALAASGARRPAAMLELLLTAQNPDGGWPFTSGGPSRIEPTSRVVQLLALEPDGYRVALAAGRGLQWLAGTQEADGTCRDDVRHRPAATALAREAAARWGNAALGAGAPAVLLGLQRSEGSWEGSAYQTAQALKVVGGGPLPDVSILAESTFLSATAATEGEWVVATVGVVNRGVAVATAVAVQAHDAAGRPMGPRAVIPALAPGESTAVRLTLDTLGHAGSDLVHVVVDPDGAIVEANEDDNRLTLPLLVSPPSSGAELFVAAESLVPAPAAIDRLPAAIQVTAMVGNAGLTPVTGAEVALIVNGARVGATTVDLAAGERRQVTVSGAVASAYVAVPVIVAVNPGGAIPEARTDNNQAQLQVPVVATVQLAVASVVPVPAVVDPRGDLVVRFVVRNAGTRDALGAQPLVTILAADGGEVGRIAPLPHTLGAGTETVLEATWRATRVGPLRARVQVSHPLDADPADDAAEAPFAVNAWGPPNLVLAAGALTVAPAPPLERRPSTLQAEVRNLGASASGPTRVAFYEGAPGAGGRELGRVAVADVAPGGSALAQLAWTPDRATATTLAAVVDPDGLVDELDEADNVVIETVKPRAIPNLVLTDGDLVPSALFPRPGDAVAVTVSVLNAGDQPSTPAMVELFQDQVGGTLLGAQRLPAIAGRGRAAVDFTWSTAGLDGNQRLVAVVNRDGAAEESRADDNTGARGFFLQGGPVAITNKYFSPNGDGVKDDAFIHYQLPAPGDLRVLVSSAKRGNVRTLTATATDRSGWVGWDGRDDRGRLLADGEYTVRVLAVAGGVERLVGSTTAVLDLNRQPFDSVRSEADVLYDFPVDGAPAGDSSVAGGLAVAAPDDSGWFYLDRWSGALLLAPRGGGAPVELARTGREGYWGLNYLRAFDVSPDGQVAMIHGDWSPNTHSYWTRLTVTELATGDERSLVLEENPHTTYDVFEEHLWPGYVAFDGDGGRLSFVVAERIPDREPFGAHWFALGFDTLTLPDGKRTAELRTDAFEYVRADRASIRGSADGRASALFVGGGKRFDGWEVPPIQARVALKQLGTPEPPRIVELQPALAGAGDTRPAQWLGDGHRVLLRAPLDAPAAIHDVDAPATPPLIVSSDLTDLAASPVGDALVLLENRGGPQAPYARVSMQRPAGAAALRLLDLPGTLQDVSWSRGGSYVRAKYAEPAAQETKTLELTSALNLGTAIKGSRPFGAAALSFVGTAADLNFGGYEVAVRRSGDANPPAVIKRSTLPVTRGVLAQWTPPAPGVYEAHLTVHDLAGNVATRKVKVGWSDQPLVANLQADPAYISPNGDGVQDAAQLSYTATQALTTRFTMTSQAGEVRHVDRTHLQAEDSAFTWDGRDDAGGVAADGRYAVGAEGTSTPVVVDTVLPEVSLALTRPAGDRCPACPETLADTSEYRVACGEGGTPIATTYRYVDARAADANLHESVLEVAAPGEATFRPFGTPAAAVSVPLSAVSGHRFRVRATDRAGNSATTPVPDEPEYLLAVGVGDGEVFEPGAPRCSFQGLPFPRLDALHRLNTRVERSGQGYVLRPYPGGVAFEPKRYAIALAGTIREPIATYAIQYSPPGSGGVIVVDTQHVTMISQNELVWDATELPVDLAGFGLDVVATDVKGRRFTAHVPFAAGATVDVCPELRHHGPFEATAAPETITLRADVATQGAPGDLGRATFTLRPLGRKALPVVIDAVPVPPHLGTGLVGTASRAQLPECRYDVTFEARSGDALLAWARKTVNLCAPQLVAFEEKAGPPRILREGGDVLLRVGHTYRPELGTLLGLDVYAGAREGQGPWSWTFGGTFTPEPEQIALVRIPWTACADPDGIRIVSRFAGGLHGEVLLAGGQSTFVSGDLTRLAAPCRGYQAQGYCASALATVKNLAPPAPRCGTSPPRWNVQLDAAIAGAPTFTALSTWIGKDPGRTVVAPFAASGFVPGGTLHAGAELDTAALREGLYSVFADLELSDHTTLPVTSKKAFIVDRTPPLLGVRRPAANAQLCPVQRQAPDGSYRSFFPIEGFLSDDWLETGTLRLSAVDEHGPSPIELPLLDFLGDPRRVAIDGTLLEVDARKLTPGAYVLELEARDATGGSYCVPQRVFEVFGEIALEHEGVAPALFSPDGDGVLDAATLSFDVNAPAAFSLTLEDEGRPTISLQRGSVGAGPNTVDWDGRASTGARVADGRHRLGLEVTDGCANRQHRTVVVGVDTAPPTVEVTSPAPGAIVGAVIPVVGLVADASFQDADVAIADGVTTAEEAFVLVATIDAPREGVLGVIPAAGLLLGDHTVRVRARDRVGHETARFVPVRVAQRDLLASLGVAPALFSPSGDGRRETAAVTFQLAGAADVAVELVSAAGGLLRTLSPAVPHGAGAGQVVVDAAAVQGIPDGDYQVRVVASLAGYSEEGLAPLAIDRAPPAVTVASPVAGAWVRGSADVTVSIQDPRAAAWRVEAGPTAGARAVVASGSGDVSGTVAALGGLADGDHTLTLTAGDEAENERVVVVPFSSDATPPAVAFRSPLAGDWVGGTFGPVTVSVEVIEAHPRLAQLSLRTAAGERVLASTASLPGQALTATWDPAGDVEGPATLVARVEDLAGNVTSREIAVGIDRTAPVARIITPRDGYLPGSLGFTGTASDTNLARYTLELASGPPAAAMDFVVVASGTAAVTDGRLATLGARPADGVYTARLVAIDQAGHRAEDVVGFVVDTTPPQAPVGLAVTLQRPRDAALTWTASASPDVVGYVVQRASGANDLSAVTATITGTSHVDPGLADGTFRWAVVAVDGAGRWSDRSNEVTLALDTRPPTVALARPASGARVGGQVEVVGTVTSDGDLAWYRLSVGEGTAPATFREFQRATAPVPYGTLGILDARGLTEGATHVLLLEAEDLAGNRAEARTQVVVDNVPPPAPVLVAAAAAGLDVSLAWSTSPVSDLAGFVVYRNGIPQGVPSSADLWDLRPYALAPTTRAYRDLAVPDGRFVYQVQAIDTTGNLSALSNALTVPLDRRAPQATLTTPAHLARLQADADVVAECVDEDVAQVQLEARAADGGPFVALGAPQTSPPFVAHLARAAFQSPVVEVRAVATDRAGNVDPAPRSAFYFFADPPAAPVPALHVDGYAVAVGWEDVGAAGYEVTGGTVSLPAPRPIAGTASASSTGSGSAQSLLGATSGSWTPAGAAPQWWRAELDTPFVLSRLWIGTAQAATADVRVKVAGAWVPVARGVALWNYVTLDPPLEVEGVELDFTAMPSGLTLQAVEFTGPRLAAAPPVATVASALGDLGVTVTAVSRFGLRTAGSALASVYQPTLAASAATVPTPSATVTGTCRPGVQVELAVEPAGAPTVVTVAAVDGAFSAEVPLSTGTNRVTARGVDAAGNRSVPSTPVQIDRVPPPPAAITLALQGVAGSAVDLAFDVAGDTSGVVGYRLVRQSADGPSAEVTLAPAVRAYHDAALPNGTYVYTVAAANASGFLGTPSNAVAAVVAITGPAAPANLAVTAPPTGSELRLAWSSTAPAGTRFEVERGLAPTALSPLATATVTSYDDRAVSDGVTYWYQVRAVDEAGNRSAPSSVASGTPRTVRDVQPPRLTSPTGPAAPIAVQVAQTSVGGLAEGGASVELFRGGVSLGTTTAGPDQLVRISLPLPDRPGRFAVDGSGTRVLYSTSTELVWEDLASGERVASPLAGASADEVWLAPDGERSVVLLYGGADGRERLFLGRRGVVSALSLADVTDASTFPQVAWAPDSARFAYTTTEAGVDLIRIVDAATGAEAATLPGGRAPSWVGPAALAYVRPSADTYTTPSTIVRYELATATGTELLEVLGVERLRGSSGGRWLAFDDSAEAAWILPLSGGAPVQLMSWVRAWNTIAFSPDDTQVAYEDDTGLTLRTLPAAERKLPGAHATRLAWTLRGLVSFGWSYPELLDFGGPFTFAGVALDEGTNVFHAVAQDASGNRSPSSEAIRVAYDPRLRPDLTVAGAVQPATPIAGAPANAVLTVRNAGGSASSEVRLVAAVVSPGGASRGLAPVDVPSLEPGAATTVLVALDLHGLLGPQALVAIVDPDRTGQDADRGNDRAEAPFMVLEAGTLAVAARVTPATVGAGETATVTVTVVNAAAPRDVVVRVTLQDSAGATLLEGFPDAAFSPLGANAAASVVRTFASGALSPGTYQAVAEALEGGAVVARGTAPLTIRPDLAVGVRVAASRATYLSGEAIALDARVENRSANAVLTGATCRFEVLGATGAVVFSAAVPLATLARGAVVAPAAAVPALAPGAYTARVTVLQAGSVLGSATASFAVLGRAVLAGSVAVDALGDPPSVSETRPLAVHLSLANSGGAAAAAVVATLRVVDPETLVVLHAESHPVGTLGAGAAWAVDRTLPTAGLGLGLRAVSLSAAVDGGAEALLASVRVRVRDGVAPTLAVEQPADGAFVSGEVSARVRAVDLGSGTAAVRVETAGHATFLTPWDGTALDGTWTGTVPLGADGRYDLVVTGTDAEGNDGAILPAGLDPIRVTVVSDTIPPDLTISGVSDGELVGTAVVPRVAAFDVNLAGVEVTLDGELLASGAAVGEDGDHVLLARAWDRAGHSTGARVAFTVDRTPPVVVWRGITDGACVNRDVTPAVDVWDAHLLGYEATLGGAPFVPGTTLTAERSYALDVTARDQVGHVAAAQLRFTIDRTAPTILLGGFVDGAIGRGPLSPTYAVSDPNLLAVEATLDGVPFPSGVEVAGDGLHLVRVVAWDAAGNRAERTGTFTLDRTPPVVDVAGVTEGEFTARAVVPLVTVSDVNLAGHDVRVDGALLPAGGAVTLEGPHLVTVDAVDLAGNTAHAEVRFTVDRTLPELTLAGFVDGADLAHPVTPTFTATDANLLEVVGVLDGAAFSSGAPVAVEGTHTLVVTATDRAGNRAVRTGTFTVDVTPPQVELGGVDRRYTNAPAVSPTFVATDARLADVVALLDGAPFASGTPVTGEGPHAIQVTARDRAGTTTTRSAEFTIDRTVPELTLAGVAPFAVVRGPVALDATALDANLEGLVVTLDGEAYASGAPIAGGGTHLARAEATDLAGNRAVATLEFTIDDARPAIAVAGVAEGEITTRDVVPAVTVTDDHLATWGVTVDGSPLAAGTAVTGEGEHVLVVTAQDLAGNTARAEVAFAIDRTLPGLSASVSDGASYDGQVVVTFAVTDAHLASVSATLDGGPVASGAVVTAAGAHALVLTGADLAGNVASRTFTFTIVEQAGGAVEATKAILRLPRVLVYAGDGCRAPTAGGERLRGLVEQAAPAGAPVVHVSTLGEFLARMRSGLHDVFVLGLLDGDGTSVGEADAACAAQAERTGPELLEAVFRGAGLLVVKDTARPVLDLHEALGASFKEDLPPGEIRIVETGLGPEATLAVPRMVCLMPLGAEWVGWRGAEMVASVNTFGRGAAAVAAFDLGAATPGESAAALLRGALAFITPVPAPGPLAVVVVGLDVRGAAAGQPLQATERVEAPLQIAGALDGGEVNGGAITWSGSADADGRAAFRWLVRLPATAGTYGAETELLAGGAGTWRRVGTYPLSLDAPEGEAELEAQARALVEALPVDGEVGWLRAEILARIAAVSQNPGLTVEDREQAIAALLDVVRLVRWLEEPARTPLWYTLDRLLGYWEAMP